MNKPRVVALLRELLRELEGEDAPGAANDARPKRKGSRDTREPTADDHAKAAKLLRRAGVYPRLREPAR